jgi:ribosomal 30S subunit maturation factor RimM
MSTPRFVHEDIVKVVATDQVGSIMEVHETGDTYVYGVQPRTASPRRIEVPEAELQLLKIANADETGLHFRYIT